MNKWHEGYRLMWRYFDLACRRIDDLEAELEKLRELARQPSAESER